MNKLRQWMESHQSLLELLVDLFAAWLLSCGVMMVICSHLGFSALAEITSGRIMWFNLLGMAAVVVFSRKWWLLPSAAAIGAAGVWVFSTTKHWESFLEKISAYVSWCLSGCPVITEEAAALAEETVHSPVWVWLLMALFCGVLTLLFMRRLFSYLLLFVISAAGIGLMFYGVYQEWIEAGSLWFTASVLLMCLVTALPRVYARYLEKHGLTHSSDQAEGGQMTISRISLQLLAVPAALLCVGSAFLFVPKDASEWKSEMLTHFVMDMGDLLRFSFGDSEGYWEFSLSTTNMYPLGDRLGGPVELSDDRIFTVRTENPTLLKGAVRDTYTGNNWTDSQDNGRFRMESLMWVGRRREALGHEMTNNKLAQELYPRLTEEVTMTIFPEYYWYSTIFTPGRLTDAHFWGRSDQIIYFNDQGEVFTQDAVGGSYVVTGTAFLPRDDGIDREMEVLERFASETTDRNYEKIAQQNLQLPDTLPDSVRQLTEKITRQAVTPYQKAAAIADWLGKNCTYSLTPEEPPADRDFVEWFLETKEGYCTYYASAMTVMARCAGLPARYISGFGLRETETEDVFYISEATGHAWVEIYFAGIGWVPFDALGWSIDNSTIERRPVADVIVREDTEEEEEEEMLSEIEQDVSEIPVQRSPYLWIVPTVLAVIALIWLLIAIILYPKRHWEENAIRRRGLTPVQWTEAFYGDFLRQLALSELSLQTGETMFEFARRVDKRLFISGYEHPMEQVAQWVSAWRFGEEEPPEESLHWLCGYHSQVERRIRIRLGNWEYFWKRCVRSFFIRK